MQIVSDAGVDLSPEQMAGLKIHQIPLTLTFEGRNYRSGIDIEPEEFYRLLDEHPHAYPTTSQPAAGEFALMYRELAKTDPEIISIHVSGGLSGTVNAARAGAAMVPEAHVTVIDTKTLSSPEGWQVEAAARGAKAGWPVEKIIQLVDHVRANSDGLFTLSTLKYLIHGGRISHITGLVASVLAIKPIITVEKEGGTYINIHREVTFKRAIAKVAEGLTQKYAEGCALRVQLLHGQNSEGIDLLRQKMVALFDCHFLPVVRVTPVFGAHTGPSLIGMAVGPQSAFTDPIWSA